MVVTHNGPLTRRQSVHVVDLTASTAEGPAAAASWSALELHGLHGWERPAVHVLVARGRTPAPLSPLPAVLHESRRFGASDVRSAHGVPATTVERSAVDAAAWSARPRTACGVLAAVVQQRLSTPERLLCTLQEAGQVRHRQILRSALSDMVGGAQAVSELDFLRFCRRHGLGRPSAQNVRIDAEGRRRYLDATLRSHSGRPVHIEIDGALHLAVANYWADMRRSNDLLLGDVALFRFPSFAVHADDPIVVRQLRQALAR